MSIPHHSLSYVDRLVGIAASAIGPLREKTGTAAALRLLPATTLCRVVRPYIGQGLPVTAIRSIFSRRQSLMSLKIRYF
jgi:hypothetical protein